MIVDNIAHSYKVFVLQWHYYDEDTSAEEFRMVVYESATNQWRNSTVLKMPCLGRLFSRAVCSIFFNGLLYVLMSPGVVPECT
jgi:hypothetical protein